MYLHKGRGGGGEIQFMHVFIPCYTGLNTQLKVKVKKAKRMCKDITIFNMCCCLVFLSITDSYVPSGWKMG